MSNIVDTSDWPDTDDIRAWVEWRTRNLRSGEPDWEPIAAQLRAHGLDPATTVLADIWPDDPSMEAVVVVTSIGQVFEFDYRWSGRDHAEGTFTSRRDLTSSWRVDAYPKAAVGMALQLLREQSQRPLLAYQRTSSAALRAHVAHHTRDLLSGSSFWREIADLLTERGIDLRRAAEGSIYSQRVGRALNLIVTAEGAVFQYGARCTTSTPWTLTEWKDLTGDETLDEHERDLIAVALEVAQSS